MVYVYVPKFVSIGLFCRPLAAKSPQFLLFFGLRYLVVSTVGCNLRKLNMSAQLQTFPYPTASKSFLYPQSLRGKIGHTNSDIQNRYGGQTETHSNAHTQRVHSWRPHSEYRLTSCVEHSKHLLSPVGTGVWTYLQTGQLTITHTYTHSWWVTSNQHRMQ